MKRLLNSNKIRAKKSLGQNFINNEEFLNKLEKKIKSYSNTNIIEIGPGKGALTKRIINKQFKKLYLIEKDRKLAKLLSISFEENKKIKIINSDALSFDYQLITGNVLILGNLPFNISTQLLFKWIEYENWPPFYNKMILMFQKEVADRIISKKNLKSYGQLSILVQARCKVKIILTAPSRIFDPIPKVDGSILEITPHNKYKDIDFKILNKILKLSFSHRRKKIKKNLKKYIHILEELDIDPNLRAEDLSVDEYCNIVRLIN